jgi:hypothetical protein
MKIGSLTYGANHFPSVDRSRSPTCRAAWRSW